MLSGFRADPVRRRRRGDGARSPSRLRACSPARSRVRFPERSSFPAGSAFMRRRQRLVAQGENEDRATRWYASSPGSAGPSRSRATMGKIDTGKAEVGDGAKMSKSPRWTAPGAAARTRCSSRRWSAVSRAARAAAGSPRASRRRGTLHEPHVVHHAGAAAGMPCVRRFRSAARVLLCCQGPGVGLVLCFWSRSKREKLAQLPFCFADLRETHLSVCSEIWQRVFYRNCCHS